MIWNSELLVDTPWERASAIAQDVQSACVTLDIDAHLAFEVGQSVSRYCDTHLHASHVPGDYVALLTARCLTSVGHDEDAASLLADRCGEVVAEACLPVLGRRDSSTILWRLCRMQAMRKTSWVTTKNELTWILDLSYVHWRPEDHMELTLVQEVRQLIEGMAHVWDEVAGRGSLGLRGIGDQVGRMLGYEVSHRRCQDMAREIGDYCYDVLTRIGGQRKWRHVPDIVWIDLNEAT